MVLRVVYVHFFGASINDAVISSNYVPSKYRILRSSGTPLYARDANYSYAIGRASRTCAFVSPKFFSRSVRHDGISTVESL